MFVEQKVVRLGTIAAADDVDVTGAARDDERGLGALALDQRIDGSGRTVNQFVDGAGLDSALVQAINDALYQVGWRGETLGLHEGLFGFVKAEQVREGSSDVDGNNQQGALQKRGFSGAPLGRCSSQATGLRAK